MQGNLITCARRAMAGPVRGAFKTLEHQLYHCYKMTAGLLLCLNLEIALVIKHNISTPPLKNGRSADIDMLLPYNKTIAIGRNESSLRFVCGNEFVDRVDQDSHGSIWFFDDHQEHSYSDDVAKKRRRDTIQSADETNIGCDYTESTMDPSDF